MSNIDLTNLIIDDLKDKKMSYKKPILLIIGFILIFTIILFIKNPNEKKNKITENKVIKKDTLFTKKSSNKKITKEITTTIIKPNYYVQVSMFKKNRKIDKYFLKKIKKHDLEFEIKEEGDFKKILIGPYEGYSSAKDSLALIRLKIQEDAFIVK